jgi:hypothetical protein
MPDKTPLAPEMFRFTQEELSLAAPETLEILMQNGSMWSVTSESATGNETATSSSSTVTANPLPPSTAAQPSAATPSVGTDDAPVA